MRAAYPFANNPYLQETVENLQPAMSRAYSSPWTSARRR
jgi:hypothetical protein